METIKEAESNYNSFMEMWRSPLPYIEAFSSGSTGLPKKISLPKKVMRESALKTNLFFDIKKGSLLYNCVSTKYIGGRMMIVRSDLSGADIISEPASNYPRLNVPLGREISLLSVVPSQMLEILRRKNEGSLPPVKAVIIGGSAINPKLRRKIVSSGLNAYETYGMTETCSHIALRKISNDNIPFSLLPDISISTDDRGCLVIDYPGLPQIVTNDVAEISSEKEFYIKGRYDNVIITGGKKIYLEDVEAKAKEVVDFDFIVTSRLHEKWGEEIILVTDCKEAVKNKNELFAYLKTKLPPESVPKDIVIIDKLPLTENGKLKRFRL